jgi:hypothetical protein
MVSTDCHEEMEEASSKSVPVLSMDTDNSKDDTASKPPPILLLRHRDSSQYWLR